ncbi:hypothetical protein J5N97_003672 [Dioscorea zingiberensis]|uniref:Uncharacterized protein n=1 Tax=Dioscorea zingiberensis TaxID=325984 RepID=A0A9D5D524_9LILI|nr:hypothetical protein J5N97_003672 [Dioscorea zingiberensis]
MLFLFLISILLFVPSLSSSPIPTRSEHELSLLYEGWLIKHNKSYKDSLEKEKRYTIFKDNLKYIDEHNAGNHTYSLGLNVFADLTVEEYRATYLRTMPPKEWKQGGNESDSYNLDEISGVAPDSIDWRDMGAIGPVRNQGGCFSCWAFAVLTTVEAINQIVTGDLQNTKVVSIDGYMSVRRSNEYQLMMAVANQPVAAAVEGYGQNFQLYTGGIFTQYCGTKVDHAVAIIGYGTKGGQDYWIIRNSWSDAWGESGYMRLERNINSQGGKCGIAQWPYYPIKYKNMTSKLRGVKTPATTYLS